MTLRRKVSVWRLILGGAIGVATAFCAPFGEDFLDLAIKTVGLALIIFAAFGRKKYLLSLTLFVLYTFLLGGIVTGIFYITQTPFEIQSGLAYQSEVPLGIYCLAVSLFCLLTYTVWRYFKNLKRIAPYLTEAKLTLCGEEISLTAFLDSGNTLQHSGLPVCFAAGSLNEKVKKRIAEAILRKEAVSVAFNTVADCRKVLALKCVLEINGQNREILLAMSQLKERINYQLILNAEFSVEGKNET